MPGLRRLAFHSIPEGRARESTCFRLSGSTPQETDCVIVVDEVDVESPGRALACYTTCQATIEKSGAKQHWGWQAVFEIWQEDHQPPLRDLFAGLALVQRRSTGGLQRGREVYGQ